MAEHFVTPGSCDALLPLGQAKWVSLRGWFSHFPFKKGFCVGLPQLQDQEVRALCCLETSLPLESSLLGTQRRGRLTSILR